MKVILLTSALLLGLCMGTKAQHPPDENRNYTGAEAVQPLTGMREAKHYTRQ